MFLHAGYEVIVTQVNLLPEVLVPQLDSFAFGYEFCVFHGRFRGAFAGCHLVMDRIYARPVWLGVQTDQCSVAAPAVGIGTIDHVGAYRVEVNIATDLQQVAVAVHQDGFEAALEQVARVLVAAVCAVSGQAQRGVGGATAPGVPDARWHGCGVPRQLSPWAKPTGTVISN